jgi:hypothetical protein
MAGGEMNTDKALEIIRALANGVDPYTKRDILLTVHTTVLRYDNTGIGV